mmetsp:Transcript_37664/g.87743  ORF Transcript_37664/g.87743 Transcript_37664/m.87743 type:complete len:198 (-) Transcript_37664:413-1006(-)
MSLRDHRVSSNRSKLQRLYCGSDLDNPTPSASGIWLSPLRHTEIDAHEILKETDVMEGKTVLVSECNTLSSTTRGTSFPSTPGVTPYHAQLPTTNTTAAPSPLRASPPPPVVINAGADPQPDPTALHHHPTLRLIDESISNATTAPNGRLGATASSFAGGVAPNDRHVATASSSSASAITSAPSTSDGGISVTAQND